MGKSLNHCSVRKRGFHLARKCPLCGMKEEELENILIHCPSIWGQWTDLLSAFGASWVCPLLVKDFLLSWTHCLIRKNAKVLWRAAPLILFWAIWKERNKVIFEDATFSTLKLKLTIIRSLFTWAGCVPK